MIKNRYVGMEAHLITFIVLDYGGTIKDWATSRVLSKEIKQIVDTKHYVNDAWGCRAFIRVNQCTICKKSARVGDFDFKNYNYFEPTNHFHIVHCRHWHCHMSAVYSMRAHCASMDMYFLKKPFQESVDVPIPRSDGSITQGKCINYAVIKRGDKFYVYTFWFSADSRYNKLVPLSYYSNDANVFD